MTEVMSLCMAVVLCMMGQASGSERMPCGVDARPHPNGVCGDRLLRARTNLCILLRKDYPDVFGKRSVDQFPITSITSMYLFAESKRTSSKDVGDYDVDVERQKRQGMQSTVLALNDRRRQQSVARREQDAG
ncbi:hypothetical protein C0Q70_11070 [Pomacea canaliculata]|uniref:Kazal-like domain-containing protein n=1 Tax=Pomacea canaliculata TaxID=400727 RepID=A0A2T7P4Y2_POMCA|nr:hypothetical protein C0Q70_11070 [Pomacea canaliculata]